MHTLAISMAGSHPRAHVCGYPKLTFLFASRNRVVNPSLPGCANSDTHPIGTTDE
jgi:hypothetical protein